jgi:exopolyphosphatase/guanosine-5'-triphosphate,3'-diphosphate pyrophosphatase
MIAQIVQGQRPEKLFSTRIAVKLGEGAINQGFIAEVPFQRGLDAIAEFSKKFEEYQVQNVLAFATSAIRDAANGHLFAEEIRQRYNITLSVIEGEREAELIYYGVREAVEMGTHTSLIMDIGGGSNEFILANKDTIFWKQSFNIGAARILDRFKQSNPISLNEKKQIEDYLTQQLEPLFTACAQFLPQELIGSSGAFDSIIEMIHGELNGEALTIQKTEYAPEMESYRNISKRIVFSTLEERRLVKGLIPIRFDMIVVSCIMIDLVLNTLHLNKLRVSTFSLKEGALAEYIQTLNNTTQN